MTEKEIKKVVKKQVKFIFENDLLLEADYKKKILDNFQLPEVMAEYLADRLGKLSIWFINALIKQDFDSKEDAINYLNEKPFYIRFNYSNGITKIIDWIRHPLVAGTVDLKNLTLQQAIENAEEFHQNLKTLGGSIDYKEENKKLVQYDNEFYWAELPGNYSEEECNRMGHCGRTSKGDMLFSLRSDIPYGKGHTLNDSHLTVAYNTEDGMIYQSKGKKNSKPSEKYFPYFFDLIMRIPNFNGFGREYSSSEDINYDDFSTDQLAKLYNKYPKAFNTYNSQKILFDRGILKDIKDITAKSKIILNLELDELDNYVSTSRDLRKDIIKMILVDPYDLYDPYYEHGNWKYSVDYINEKNKKTILEYISKKHPDIDISSNNLEEIISENDDDLYDIISAINRAAGDSESSDYQSYCYNQLKSTLEHWGNVEELNDTGAKIEIDLEQILDNVDAFYLNDALDRCEGDQECAFHELVSDGNIDSPKLMLDDRYSPSIDKQDFNSYLVDALDFEL
jgi:hypothetical protein